MKQTFLTKEKYSFKLKNKENHAPIIEERKKVMKSFSMKLPPKDEHIVISDDDDKTSVIFLSPNPSKTKKRTTSPCLYEHKPKSIKIELSPSGKSMADSGNDLTSSRPLIFDRPV